MRLGLWSFAHPHADAYLSVLSDMPGVEMIGVADENSARGRRRSDESHIPFFAEPEKLLHRVDGVIITSANVDHCSMALRAAQAGVHALVEKPIATSVPDAETMIKAFDSEGLVLGTAFPCPFSPAFQGLLGTTRSDGLGKILAMMTTNRGTMPGGFFIQRERSGGGAVIDHTVHVADLLRRLTGCEPTRVYAEVGYGLFHEAWDDSGILTIDFDDGSFATLDCSWSRPGSFPTWGDVTLKVVGERGNAYATLFGQHLQWYPGAAVKPSWLSWGSNLDSLMIDDFVKAVRGDGSPKSSGEDGLWALKVALAAYESAKRGKPVRVEDIV